METIRVTRFGGDLLPTPDEFGDLKSLVEQVDDLYPGIDKWYKRKVVSGFNQKDRTAYIVYQEDKPVAASVLKLGKDAKICSLRVLPDAEKEGYGALLMALVARDMRSHSKVVHFTIPDSIWNEKAAFFEKYGFKMLGPVRNQYRSDGDEFYCSGEFGNMWSRVTRELPKFLSDVTINGYRPSYDLLMSLRPEYADGIMNGTKTVEVRRRFSTKWVGSHVLVYSSLPEGSFVGSFHIANVVHGAPDDIWQSFSAAIGCSRKEFASYARGADRVWAIITENRRPFSYPIPSSQVQHLVKRDFNAPQSYAKVKGNSTLEEIGTISAFLQVRREFHTSSVTVEQSNLPDPPNESHSFKPTDSNHQLSLQL